MSITISNWKEICDANTNRSPSKMAYSFSRAHRFNPQKENRYLSLHLDHKCSTKLQEKIAEELPVLDMEISTISPKSNSQLIKSTQQSSSQYIRNSYRL